jgi:hypothetical protein
VNRQSAFDDVEKGIEDLAQSKKIREMSEDERKRRKKDMERVRGRYDMPRAVKDGVAEIANQIGVSHSSVAALLLAESLRRLRNDEISLYKIDKDPSESPKYDFSIPDDEVLKVLEGKKKL